MYIRFVYTYVHIVYHDTKLEHETVRVTYNAEASGPTSLKCHC